ncbi:MAG: translation elongation factor Ts [Acidobacteria bacterium]|nr:translation elongation factor Ts [Acidobacteriota bacterium]
MQVTANMVKELRDKTGAGMMDCKKALVETSGEMEKAIEYLRKKGISAAEGKAHRATNEGVIHAYIHSNHKVGVLVEVNCESDFVARNENFHELAHNIAMQIAAAKPLWVKPEDVPNEILEKEKEIYRAQMADSGKPENVIDKIVEGKLNKFFKETCLLDQEYIKDTGMSVREYVSSVIAIIGENIQVERFVRYALGGE